jgi:hypothetical protein
MASIQDLFLQLRKREEPEDELGFRGLYFFLFLWFVLCTSLTLFLFVG